MKLVHFLFAFALVACAPPAEQAPEPEAPAVQAAGDCVGAAEALPIQDAPQPSCDWAALNASATADSYVGYYASSNDAVEGALAVAVRADGSYAVGVSTVFAGSLHMCGATFNGRVEGADLALAPIDDSAQVCTARLVRAADGEITMRTEGNCSNYCGARAALDGVTFRRAAN